MNLPLLRNALPSWAAAVLWGDRRRWGLRVDEQDPCWEQWQAIYADFYDATQRGGVGLVVNDAGYRIMARLDLEGKTVLEIGSGDIRHTAFWNGTPREYLLAEVQESMMQKAEAKLASLEVPTRSIRLQRGDPLPLADGSVDVILAFYSLEHIYPLAPYLKELDRVLRPGGRLAGAIPAEGGLAWGLGRSITSRRWFKKHTRIDPDKIICWEHPNFGDEIIRGLDQVLVREQVGFWPFPWVPSLDFNLLIRFAYRKME
jgi:SAM-dependent methyltransferase